MTTTPAPDPHPATLVINGTTITLDYDMEHSPGTGGIAWVEGPRGADGILCEFRNGRRGIVWLGRGPKMLGRAYADDVNAATAHITRPDGLAPLGVR